MKISDKTTIKRNPSLIAKKINSKLILFDLYRSKIYHLNTTAEEIWRFTYKKKTIPQVIKHISTKFQIISGQAEKDVKNFLSKQSKDIFDLTLN